MQETVGIMKTRLHLQRSRALVWFMATLAVLLGLGAVMLMTHQRDLMRAELLQHLERETRLFADAIERDLSQHRYAAISSYAAIFAKDHDEIAGIRIVAPGGGVLASYEKKPVGAAYTERQVRQLDAGGRSVSLEFLFDFSPLHEHLVKFLWRLVWASLAFVVVMGAVLWKVLRKTAFDPLERTLAELHESRAQLELRVAERTADWMLSNKELKEEIAERLDVERQMLIKDRAIASSINGIALADFDGRLNYVNEAFLRLWGYGDVREVLGRPATEFWQEPAAAAEIMQSITITGSRVGELTALRGDGTAFEARLAADVVRDSAGTPLCLMASFIDVTERKRAETALRKQKDFTTAVLDIIGAITVVLDRDGKIIRFNRECERISQYTAAEAVGNCLWDLVVPVEQREAVQGVFRNLAAGQFPSHYENDWVAKDGTRRLIAWSNTCLTDDAGKVEFVIATGIDIAQSRAAEVSLRNSEERLRSVTDAVTGVIYRRKPDGTITYASPSVQAVLGYAPEEVIGRNFRDFAHPDSLDTAVSTNRMLLDGVTVRDQKLRVFRKSGEVVDVEVTLVPLRNDAGVFEIQAVLRDVTERKATEEALRASETRYRRVVENINEIIYQVAIEDNADPFRAKVEFVSGQVENIVGYSVEEFLRDPRFWLSIIHRDDLPVVAESARRLVAERKGGTRIYRVRNGTSGSYLWMEDKVVPRVDDAGRITGYFGVARDITKRKNAEDALMDALARAEEEKNKSAAVIAAIGDAISIQDRDFKVLYQNEKHKQLIGSHVGEFCFEAYEKRQEICGGCPVALSFADGKVHTVERAGKTDDGQPVSVEITTSPLRDASGRIIAGIEVARDISGRKRMEQELRIALETQSVVSSILGIPAAEVPLAAVMQEALKLILASSLYSFHSIGGIFLRNEGTNKLDMIAQQGFGAYILESCREVPLGMCLCGRAAKSGRIEFASDLDDRHEIRFPGIQPHGHYCVPIRFSEQTTGLLTLYLEQGHKRDAREEEFLRSVASALAVIIHRKRMEQDREALIGDLRRLVDVVSLSQKEWRETFDGINDPIIVIGTDRNVRKANRAFSALFGMRPQDVINRDCLELLYRGQTPPEGDPILTGLREARAVEGEITDPASQKTFRVSVFPSTMSEKEPPGAIAVLKDITAEREREMRLIMSERLASLGQMASGIAHEINNPLAAIAGCVDGMTRRIVREQYDPELFTRYLKIIKEEITRSKNITTSMLSFVRKSSYEKKQVNLHEAIEKTIEIIGYQGRLKQAAVERKFAPSVPTLFGSEGELRQVFLIVMSNALDAMHDAGTLTVATDSDDQTVTVDIGDAGQGIAPENMQRIFDPFFTTKSEKGGTGLGLSIAQRIIEAHSGTIRVLSTSPSGTTIRITLPVSASSR